MKLVALPLALLVCACPGREISRVDPDPKAQGTTVVPVSQNRDIDILFVIDDSGSMGEEQTSLAANFDRFIDVLENIDGGLPNVHIGVVSTDLGAGPYGIGGCSGDGDEGALHSAPAGACSPPDGAYIVDIDDGAGGRTRNYTGALDETFSCIAELGTTGCGFEQPLESMRRALDGSNPANAGFLRPDALLGVVIITDEDDCSTFDSGMFDTSQTGIDDPLGPLSSFRCFEFGVECEPDDPRSPGPRQDCAPREDSPYMYGVAEYVDFLKGLKDDPRDVIVAGILGNPTPVVVGLEDQTQPILEPSCVSASGEAAPAVRLAAFLDGFPGRNTVSTICNEDMADALMLIAELLAEVVGNSCVEGDIDTDAETPGVQYVCQVSDVQDRDTPQQVETALPECSSATPDAAELPCWRLVADPDKCCTDGICVPEDGGGEGLSVVVERGGATVPDDTDVVVRCVVDV